VPSATDECVNRPDPIRPPGSTSDRQCSTQVPQSYQPALLKEFVVGNMDTLVAAVAE
jgi:hypothetical protein